LAPTQRHRAPLDPDAFANALARVLDEPAPARRALTLDRRLAAHDPARTLRLVLEQCFSLLG
jgi:hypothetical protein